VPARTHNAVQVEKLYFRPMSGDTIRSIMP
jgi:hypothetical protein